MPRAEDCSGFDVTERQADHLIARAGIPTARSSPQPLGGSIKGTSAVSSDAIRAKMVLGTSVKDAGGDKIGTIEDIVLDELSSNIVFAIVCFGGFLGMGERYHPIPWSSLKYDERDDGYVVNFTRAALEAAPADSIDALVANNGMAYRDRACDYYQQQIDGRCSVQCGRFGEPLMACNHP